MRLKNSKVETIALLEEVFQNETLHDSTIRRWRTVFTDGRESAEIERVGGRPRTVVMDVNINSMHVVIEEDHHSSIQKLADDLHIRRMSIQHILTKELGMKPICSTWVPPILQTEEIISHDPVFLSHVITADKF